MSTDQALWRRVLSNSGLGVLSSAVILLATVWRTVLLGRWLDLQEMGRLFICINFYVVFRLLTRIGLSDTLLRFVPAYETSGEASKLSGVVRLCAVVALGLAVLCIPAFVLAAPWIATAWYGDDRLVLPLQIFAVNGCLFLLYETCSTLLRLSNRFALAVLPLAGTSALVPPVLILLHANGGGLDLVEASWTIAMGETVGILVIVAIAATTLARGGRLRGGEPLVRVFRRVRGTMFHTSLFGIVRSGSESGGLFLLGILGGPAQAALFGMAMQLARPLNFLQSSIGNAVAPEMTRLHAEADHAGIYRFVNRFVGVGLLLVAAGGLIALPVGEWLVNLLLKPDYLDAIPIFVILAVSYGTVLACNPFLPLAVARGEMARRNGVACLRFVYLGIAAATGLTAISVALVQLAGSLTIRLCNDLPLYLRLRRATLPNPRSLTNP